MPEDNVTGTTSVSNDQLEMLKHCRKYIRGKITRNCNQFKSSVGDDDVDVLSGNIEILENLQDEISKSDADIRKLLYTVKDTTKLDREMESCDAYIDSICSTKRLLKNKLKVICDRNMSVRSDHSASIPSGAGHRLASQIKLPQLPLPDYSNSEGECLETFLDQYENIVEKYNLNNYEKYVFLLKQLSKEPLALVKSLHGTNQSYGEAKALLQQAFASPLKQKHDIIDKLNNLNLSNPNLIYTFISEVRTIIQTFDRLTIGINDVIRYFVWASMPKLLQDQFITITNSNHPTLEEINKCIFDAAERYNNVRKVNKPSNAKLATENSTGFTVTDSTTGLAASIQNVDSGNKSSNNYTSRYKLCALCSDSGKPDDHPMHQCNNFPSNKDKVDKLRKMQACTSCGYTNHTVSNCYFKFKKTCIYCQGNHFNFLCMKSDTSFKSVNSNKDRRSERTAAHRVTVNSEVLYSSNNTKIILPTFSGKIPDGSTLRCLKDSGCQKTFISEKIVKNNNFKVIESDIVLNIEGFNTQKTYHVNLVEVPLQIGENVRKIHAICVPEIKIDLYLPDLNSVTGKFAAKNFVFADKGIMAETDHISDIEMILGSNYFHLLPERDVVYGNDENPSMYSETPIGVVLYGEIKQIIPNLDYLGNNFDSKVIAGLTVGSEETKVDKIPAEPNVVTSTEDHTSNVTDNNSIQIGQNYLYTNALLSHDGLIEDFQLDNLLTKEDNFGKLNKYCHELLNIDVNYINEDAISSQVEVIDFALSKTQRDETGRLVMPILWDENNSSHLANNFFLSKQILESLRRKYQGDPDRFEMIDLVIKDQLDQGIIEEISDLDEFRINNKDCSFLPHKPVFKLDNDTTKCRVVYMSNLCEKSKEKLMLSHNQTIKAGPPLNHKMSTAFNFLRFDEKLLVYDLKKAFLQLRLYPEDTKKLCFLWFKDISNGDFTIVSYCMARVPFGLRCSPCLLMVALYKILIIDISDDEASLVDLKKLMYHLLYVDNGAISFDSSEELRTAYNLLESIFKPYHFALQKFITNDVELQVEIDAKFDIETPIESKMLGIMWNRVDDTLSVSKLYLDAEANTKRSVLRCIASNYDLFNFCGPLLNRARLFLHELQCDSQLGWDDILHNSKLKEWRNIAKQLNSAERIKLNRFVGHRGDTYRLIAYTDSSSVIYGVVIFLESKTTRKRSFLLATNRIVNKQLESKSIPSLELQAVVLGTEVLQEVRQELSGSAAVLPCNIVELILCSDSQVCIDWLNNACTKMEKMNRKPVFVQNRLATITSLCNKFPIEYRFVAGLTNPSDMITRPVSYKKLVNSTYFCGVDIDDTDHLPKLIIPNPKITKCSLVVESVSRVDVVKPEQMLNLESYSDLSTILNIYHYVTLFIRKLKSKIGKNPTVTVSKEKLVTEATKLALWVDQHQWFGDLFEYFDVGSKSQCSMPNIVAQLNVFLDKDGLLKVRCKRKKWGTDTEFPILMSKLSRLSYLIIGSIHKKLSHGGVYTVLAELRDKFWIAHAFSLVKKIIRSCITCRKMNGRPIRLNQNEYRHFRINPPNVPFRYLILDYFGPCTVKLNNVNSKVYVLIISCLWSRAINLKICRSMTVDCFLKAFQMHCFEYGVAEYCLSDMGSNIVAAGKIISDFINDENTKSYFAVNNVKSLTFDFIPKGCKKLAGLIEICVKMVKRLIFGSVGKLILEYFDFDFLISQMISLVNRRPIAFKAALRDNDTHRTVPNPITPEMLIRGYELVSLNVIPGLNSRIESDLDWVDKVDCNSHIRSSFTKLCKARTALITIYNKEFMKTLMEQATNVKDRYRPINHTCLQRGDIVLVTEEMTKPVNYPMGIIEDTTINDLGEVTSVKVRKGCNRELIERHSSAIIPLLAVAEYENVVDNEPELIPMKETDGENVSHNRPKRKAALESIERSRKLLDQGQA